jgi:hypothetical protein
MKMLVHHKFKSRRLDMKKGLSVIVVCLFVLAFVGRALAVSGAEWSEEAMANKISLAKEMRFTGRVVSHESQQHSLAVDTSKGVLTFEDDYARFMQEYNEAKGIRVGAPVQGTYKTVNHVNYLTWIRYTE